MIVLADKRPSRVLRVLVVASLFIAYSGHTYFAYFLFLIILIPMLPRLSLRTKDALFLSAVITFAVFKAVVESDPVNVYQIFRFFFGFTLFLVFFRQVDESSLNVTTALIIAAVVTLIEAFLVNTFLPISVMPHFPHSISIGAPEGFYQRAYGFAYNPSATSTLLVCLMTLSLRNTTLSPLSRYILDAIGAAAVIACASGMGYFLLAVYFIFLSRYGSGIKGVILLGAALGYLYYFFVLDQGPDIVDAEIGIAHKISPDYLHFLTSYKLELTDEIPDDLFQLLIGRDYGPEGNIPLLSDFGWLDFLATCGVMGLLLYGWCILSNLRPSNCAPLLILLLGATNYGGLFTLPGQILFAYCLMGRTSTRTAAARSFDRPPAPLLQ